MQEPKTATIIVVDDDASMRRALQMQLQTLGFNVQIFPSGEELMQQELPAINACLLLDVYMPGMSGLELCRSLAAAGRRLPIILMSGRNDPQTRQIMRRAKPIAFLFKPFDENSLLRTIRKAIPSLPKVPP